MITTGLDFSQALALLKEGRLLQREGWNGKGMFIYLVSGSQFAVNRAPLLGIFAEGTPVNYHGHVDMKTANGECVPWLCSQTDMLAEDWQTVEAVDQPALGHDPNDPAKPVWPRPDPTPGAVQPTPETGALAPNVANAGMAAAPSAATGAQPTDPDLAVPTAPAA